jgi:predicted CXXCH cytochrome family protein
MKRLFIIAGIALAIGLIWSGMGFAKKTTHLDRRKNDAGCAGCHAGSGVPGTPLLKKSWDTLCFICHGTIKKGKKGEALTDMEEVFAKQSIHPIFETSKYHLPDEELPEMNPSAPRHVACEDCHRAHLTVPEIPWAGAKGYAKGKQKMKYAIDEYELCYLCHSDSANLPDDQTNKMEDFDSMNPSYHPIEDMGRNPYVPSLVKSLKTTSIIKCSDCHGNNDPLGTKGPHGSDYKPLLIAEYKTDDGPESPKRYELCYLCHDRRSILEDESFNRHKLHIVYQYTACFTCHDSHGSKTNQNLIEFNLNVVQQSPASGGPEFVPWGQGMDRCYLLCHNIDHNIETVNGKPWPVF